MLKRKIFIKHEDESFEQYENRINTFFTENDKLCKPEDNIGHSIYGANDGTCIMLLFYRESKDDPQKQKIGF